MNLGFKGFRAVNSGETAKGPGSISGLGFRV